MTGKDGPRRGDRRAGARDAPDLSAPRTPRGGVPRRAFLRGLAGLGAGGALGAVFGADGPAGAVEPGPWSQGFVTAFPDGIMAGDPRPWGAALRTRVLAPAQGGPVPVFWAVATDPELHRVVRGGITWARAAGGHSLTVEVDGLEPDRWYHYGFWGPGAASPVGRLRTAPREDAHPDRLRYAFCSCQQRNASLYVAHRSIAREDIDFFMHLGDYIYVSDTGDLTLDDYRRRWRIFQSHPLLQELQAAVPIVPMFDDGEFYNGVDRTGDPARLDAARQAWHEAMPVPRRWDGHVYRPLRWGRLADVFMIEVRSYRDPEVPANTVIAGQDGQDSRFPPGSDMFDPARTTLGRRQQRWLFRQLERSRARWRFVGNPYNINPWKFEDLDTPELRAADPDLPRNGGIYVSNEAWDDYQIERRELLQFLERRGIGNVVFTSGHTHFYIASELQADFDDPAARTAAFDFVTGSLTADPDPREIGPVPFLKFAELVFLLANDPYMKYVNLLDQGYAVVDATPEETVVEYKVIDTFDPDATARVGARFRVRDGSTVLETLFDERPPVR